MTILNPTPAQQHRRQMILGIIILLGVPILNSLLQKWGIPPIVVPPQILQQQTTSTNESSMGDVSAGNVHLCALSEHETLPINLERGPIRRLVKSRFARERGILHRIYERRHPSASAACPSYIPVPPVEAPATITRGCGLWYGCQAQCCP